LVWRGQLHKVFRFGDRLGDGRQGHSPLRDGDYRKLPAYIEATGIRSKTVSKKMGGVLRSVGIDADVVDEHFCGEFGGGVGGFGPIATDDEVEQEVDAVAIGNLLCCFSI